MLAEVTRRHAIHPPLNGHAGREVFELIQPLLKRIAPRCGEVVADLHSLYLRLKASRRQVPRRAFSECRLLSNDTTETTGSDHQETVPVVLTVLTPARKGRSWNASSQPLVPVER